MGVGAMMVGGLSSMWSIRAGMVKSVREAIAGLRASSAAARERTDQDMPASHMLAILAVAAVATIFLYQSITGSVSIAVTAGILMVIASFFFAAVSSYIVGLVGSSNNPISGMTICALMFASIVLLLLGMSGTAGVLGALGVAGVVCCAAGTAGDTSQDLKTGYLVGATPRWQQVALLIGVTVPSFLIAPVLTLLHNAYGIGTGGEQALRAPQATLFASIAQALFGGRELPWGLVALGVGVGVALLITDAMLRRAGSRFSTPVMPVAVGIYLPMSLSVPIFAGGILNYLLGREATSFGQAAAERASHRAVLISSGLIAGEAVAGILIAIPRTLPQLADRAFPIQVLGFDNSLLTVVGFLAVIVVMYRACRPRGNHPPQARG
jgi:putative OPT family oligopeptide transporter